jgi:hypothetical protein
MKRDGKKRSDLTTGIAYTIVGDYNQIRERDAKRSTTFHHQHVLPFDDMGCRFIGTSRRFQESRHFFFNSCCTSYFLCSYILTS